MSRTVDVEGPVANGWLDLDDIAPINGADWHTEGCAATYVACCFGVDGDQPGEVEVELQRATAYGIELWRWSDAGEDGPPRLTEAEARADAEEHASDSDETPDIDDQIEAILDTGYFGDDATVHDIRRICDALCGHARGVLLLPRGVVPSAPLGRLWTTNGYLECEHIQVDATNDTLGLAAATLLASIRR